MADRRMTPQARAARLGTSLDWVYRHGQALPTRCSARLGRAGWQSQDSHNMNGNAHIEMYEEEPAA